MVATYAPYDIGLEIKLIDSTLQGGYRRGFDPILEMEEVPSLSWWMHVVVYFRTGG